MYIYICDICIKLILFTDKKCAICVMAAAVKYVNGTRQNPLGISRLKVLFEGNNLNILSKLLSILLSL